jgi:hypothetical protein
VTEAQQATLKKAIHELGEQFDTVQIFVTVHQPAECGGTLHASSGVGNWYARVGQVNEWLTIQNEESKCHVRRDWATRENEDDGEA